jgi:hypothetical protein
LGNGEDEAVGAHDCHFLSASLLSGSFLPFLLPSGRVWSTFFGDGRFSVGASSFELSLFRRARFLMPSLDELERFKVLETLTGPESSVGALAESLDERRMLSMVVRLYVSARLELRRTTRKDMNIARTHTLLCH